jgi:hypothetical protein
MVQLLQDGIGVLGQFRNTGKHIFIRVAIDEHGSTSSRTTGSTSRMPILAPVLQVYKLLYSRQIATATSTRCSTRQHVRRMLHGERRGRMRKFGVNRPFQRFDPVRGHALGERCGGHESL